MTENNHLAF